MLVKAELADSFQGEVDHYGSFSLFVAQVMRLKTSFVEGEKHWKKDFEYTTKVCYELKVDRIFLWQKKDEHVNAFKSLEEEVTVVRQKSQESLQRDMDLILRSNV